MTRYIEKKTIKYRNLREILKKRNPKHGNWYAEPKVYESDRVTVRRRMEARSKIEEFLEDKELDW